jgi:hypothetical protein
LTSLFITMQSFSRNRAIFEDEGVLVGGWDPRIILTPRKIDGRHGNRSSAKRTEIHVLRKSQIRAKIAFKEKRLLKPDGQRRRSVL